MAHIMELTINDKVYQFKAGFAFIREVEPMRKQKQNGLEEDVGLNMLIGGLYDRDADDLLTVLYAMNKGQQPRVTRTDLEEYIEECDDIEGLFKQVNDFLLESNCTKAKTAKLGQMYDRMMENQGMSAPGGTSTGNA